MTKVCMVRVPAFEGLATFAPCSDGDQNILREAKELIFDYKKKRSPGNHRRYYAFINNAFDMQDHFDNPEIFRKYIQVQAGHFDLVISPKTGEAAYWPKSISWDELDETEFRPLFNNVINAFIRWYGQRLTQQQINQLCLF